MNNYTKDSHYNIHVLRVFYFTAATVDVSKEEWMYGTPSSPSSNNSCSSHLDDRPSIPNLSRRRMVAGPFQKPLQNIAKSREVGLFLKMNVLSLVYHHTQWVCYGLLNCWVPMAREFNNYKAWTISVTISYIIIVWTWHFGKAWITSTIKSFFAINKLLVDTFCRWLC